ncbi:MAG: D-2-hydroxyacid dehydrogenase [Clostridia bacterium]|nr:D-2-hydroxyacid dehydrogenase [Clostridia bacterium]
MKILITDADTVFDTNVTPDFLKEFGELTVCGLSEPADLETQIADAEMILCNKTPLTAELLQKAKKLKYIGLFATGYNNIDVAYAADHGITVCNAPGYSTEAVAQHAVALMLAILNRVGEYNQTVKEGDWIKSRTFSYFPFPLYELAGKTVGIVGYGSIGRRVTAIAKAFGMRVLICNRRKVEDDTVTQTDLDTLLRESDVVSLHCPLNEDSKGMMDAAAFDKMKKGSVFINTARGGLVDENALRVALDSGHLLGAGIDVLRKEPMTPDCPLLDAPNCYLTPHIAWAGLETRNRLMTVVAENIRTFLAGKPQNVVK